MTTLTVPVVTGWRPAELLAAADRLDAAAASVDDDARVVRRHLGDAVDDAGGVWAATAASRADREARRGEALADALRAASVALRDGGARLGDARDRLLDAVGRAHAAGFEVLPDGRVPSGLPPAPFLEIERSPEEGEVAQRVADRCAAHQAEVLAALADVAATDQAVADTLAAVEHPTTLPTMVAAHLLRAERQGGHVAALGPAGGAVVVGQSVYEAGSLVSDGRDLATYASLAIAGAARPVLDQARRAFAFGTSTNPVMKVLGRVSLPSTIASGAMDVGTGGGYEGARGWATRGFGAAGAAGAAAVLAGTAPAVVVVGGAAVLAYGAWSAGNYLIDHWDQVEDAWEATDEWCDEQLAEAGEEVDDAVDWAHDHLASAGSEALDAIGDLFS